MAVFLTHGTSQPDSGSPDQGGDLLCDNFFLTIFELITL
jgi:hypothetical protein